MKNEHRIVREARRLAAESPDFVYTPPLVWAAGVDPLDGKICRYVHEGKGSCIFGQALVNLGYLDPTTTDLEDVEGHSITTVVLRMEIEIPDVQRLWADEVQNRQDTGATWANAVAIADDYIKEYE
jgi:predicted aconitase with swiveling domain